MRPQSWIFFLQIGLTESMLSGVEKEREIILLTVLDFFWMDGKIASDGEYCLF